MDAEDEECHEGFNMRSVDRTSDAHYPWPGKDVDNPGLVCVVAQGLLGRAVTVCVLFALGRN
jgi:hypothetical protein